MGARFLGWGCGGPSTARAGAKSAKRRIIDGHPVTPTATIVARSATPVRCQWMTMPMSLALAPSRARSWGIYVLELLLVGGVTPLLFPISWLMRKKLGLDDAEFVAGFTTFYAAHLINDPHFSVTYLLFYKDV